MRRGFIYGDRVTKVVHLKNEEFDVLIDRTTIWGNPFVIGRHGSRADVIDKYRKWILNQPNLLSQLNLLKGKRLGCWCAPEPCHGDVLVELIEELE
ncbi:MAG: DUF4326 domain-containing protein [Planctomycetes bacterium]|nr:DUF4326 domain-containing protein [Planctomycetota bacterium]